MENYYNSLNGSMVTWFKKTSTNLFVSSKSNEPVASTFRNSYTQVLFVLLLVASLIGGQRLSAQTYLSENFEGPWYLNGNPLNTATAAGPNAPNGWAQTRVLNDVPPIGGSTLGAADWAQAAYAASAYAGTTTPYVGTAPYGPSYIPGAPVNGNNILWFRDGSCPTGNTRRIETPTINLSGSTSPLFTFSYSYGGSGTVTLVASNDGGATWNTISTISNSSSAWALKSVVIPSIYKVANAKFGFQIAASYGSYDVYIDNVVLREGLVPNAVPTSFAATNVTKTGMTIGWSDSSTNETAFRVYRSTDNVTFTQVGSDISSTTSAGTGTAYSSVQTGLLPGTTYYYRVVAALEGETAPLSSSQATVSASTYYWVGASGAAWQSPNSWNTLANGSGSPRTQSDTTDVLILDGAGTVDGASTTIVLQASQTVGTVQITNSTAVSIVGYSTSTATLTLSGGAGDELSIPSGSSLTLNHATFPVGIAFSGTGTGNTGSIAGTLNMGGSSNNTLTTTGGTGTVVTVSGTVNNGGTVTTSLHIISNAATLVFTAAGIYNHTYTLGGTVPTATWNVASNVNFTGLTSAATSVSLGSGQTFGNVTWNPTAQGSAVINLGIGVTTTIAGNLTISTTGSGSLGLTNTSGMTLNIGGNYVQNGGYVYLLTSTSSGIVAVAGNTTIASGATLDLSSSSLTSGSGTFRTAGSFTNNGTITETGISTGSTLEYNGSIAQAVNVGTANNNITYRINNNAGINLTGAMAIANGSGLIISSTAATPINGGTLTYASSGTTLTYNSSTGNQTVTANEWKSSGGPFNVTISNTTAAPNNRVFLGSLGNRTISGGVFSQSAGITVLDSSNITIAATATLTGSASNSNFIANNSTGRLFQTYSGTVLSRIFPLGDITGTDEASSVTLAYTVLTGVSTVGIGVTDAQHPSDTSTSNFLSRYFSVTETGATDYTYNLTLNYPSGEITGLNALTRLNRWNGLAWNATSTTVIPGTSSVAVTGVTFATNPLNNSAFTLRPFQGTYTWKGGTSGSFAAAASWSPSRTTPDATDVLVFDGSNIDGLGGSGAISATAVASQTIGKFQLTGNANVSLYSNASATITINGSEGLDFDIASGSTLSLAGAQAVSFAHTSNANPNANTAAIAGTLNLNSTAASGYSATNSVTTVTGTINNTTGTFTGSTTSLIFGAASNYNHLYPSGGAVPTATWNATSNINFPGPSSTSGPTNVGGQTFGNFNWNPTAQGTVSINLGISSTTTAIAGNLTISSTGSAPSATQSNFGFFSTTSSSNLVVAGNFNLNSGYFVNSTTGTSNLLLVGGNVVIASGATLDLATGTAGASTFRFNNTLTNNGTITVSGTGTGSFFVFNGTTNQSVTLGTITGAINVAQFNAGGVNLNGGVLPIAASRTLQIGTTSTAPITNGSVSYATGSILSYTGTAGTMYITDITYPASNGPTSLTINNTGTPNRVLLNTTGDRSITTLTNTAGVLLLGNNSLTATAFSGSASGSNFVATDGTGQLKYVFSAASSAIFPLGDITGTDEVSTVTLQYTTLPTPSTVGVRVIDAKHPNDVATTNNYLTRYYSFTETGGGAATYNLTLGYQSGDVVGIAGSTKLNRYNGSTWNEVSTATPTTTSVSATGISLTANGLNGSDFSLRPASRNYLWTNGSADGKWTTAGNWSPARTTADISDELTFDGGTSTVTDVPTQTIARLLLTNNATVSLQSPASNTLTIGAGAAGTDLDIPSGSTLNLTNGAFGTAIAFSGTGTTASIAGTLNLSGNAGNTFTTTGGTGTVVTVTGTTNAAASLTGSTSSLIYSGTASYNHNFSSGGAVPTASWGATTNLNFPGPTDSTIVITGIGGQTFGNFNWNATSQGAAVINLTLSSAFTVAGNMNISATGGGSLRFTTTGSSTYTVNGNYSQANGTSVVLSNGSGTPLLAIVGSTTIGTGATFDLAAGAGSATLRMAGNFTNNGTLTESGTSTASTVNFNGTGAQAVSIGTNTNTLLYTLTNASALNLSGTLNVTTGASFNHGSSGTITGSGSIVYTGITGLTYSGSTPKTQSLEWPATFGTTPTVTVNLGGTSPNNRLTMTASRSLTAGTFAISSGVTVLGNFDLTLGSAVTLGGSAPSSTNFIATNGTGQLFRGYAIGGGSFTFPIGDIDGTDELSTFVLNYTALLTASTVGVRVIDAQHPSDTSIDNFASRYFKVTETGGTGYVYTATLNYQAADFVGTGAFAKLYRFDGTSFVTPTANAIAGTTTTATTGAIAGYTLAGDPLNGSDFTVRPYTSSMTWIGADGFGGNGVWTNTAHWSGGRTPLANDVLTFNSTAVITGVTSATASVGKIVLTGSANIQLQANAASTTLTINGGTGTDLDIPSGTTFAINSAVAANTFTLAYGAGATVTIAGTFIHGGGPAVITHNATGAQITVAASTGVYTNNTTAAVLNAFTGFSATTFVVNGAFNLNVSAVASPTIPTGTYNPSSTVKVAVSGNVAATPVISGTFNGNFVIDNGTNTGAVVSSGSPTINGNLTITSAGAGVGTHSFGTGTITVNGLTILTAGTITSSTNIYNFNGGLTQNGGTISTSASATINVGNASTPGVFTQAAAGIISHSVAAIGAITLNLFGDATIAGNINEGVGATGTVAIGFRKTITGAQNINTTGMSQSGSFTYTSTNTPGVNLTGTLLVNGAGPASTFTHSGLGVISGGTFTYGAGSSLTYSATGGSQTAGSEWPSTNSPVNVTVNNTTASPNNRVFFSALTGDRSVSLYTQQTGVLVLGANSLTATSLSGLATNSNFVATNGAGQLKYTYSALGTAVFPIGDITNTDEASPVTLSYTALSGTSTVGVRVSDAQQPNDPSATDYLARYYSFTESGATGLPGTSTASLTLTYPSANVVGNYLNTRLNRWNGSAWTQVAGTVPSLATTISVSGIDYTAFNGNDFTLRPGAAQNYTWIGVDGAAYNVPSNWGPSPRSSVDASDVLIFDGSNGAGSNVTAVPSETVGRIVLQNNANVILKTGVANCALTINGGVGADLDIPVGSTLTLFGESGNVFTLGYVLNSNATANIAGNFNLGSSGNSTAAHTYAFTNGVTTIASSGTFTNNNAAGGGATSASATSLIINGTYVHNPTPTNGGTIPTATVAATSTINVRSGLTSITFPAANSIGNLILNNIGSGTTAVSLGLSTATIQGNLTVNSTGTSTGGIALGSAPTVTVNGTTTITAGKFDLANSTSGGATFNALGNIVMNGGSIGAASTSGINTLNVGNIGTAPSLTMNSGSTITSASSSTSGGITLNLFGDLTMNSGSTITESAAGNVLVNFAKTLSGAQNIALNGAISNSVSFRQSNTTGVNFSSGTVTFDGSLTPPATFTHSSTGVVSGLGTIAYSGAGSLLTYNGTANQTAGLEWPSTSGPTNVTINNTGASATTNLVAVPFSRTIAGTLTMTTGNIDLTSNTLTLGTSAVTPGTLAWTAGTIRVTTGALTRWFPASGLPIASTGTSVGFYPLAIGVNNRAASVYFSAATITTGGTVTASHTDANGLADVSPSFNDPAYTVNKRTNASWTFTQGNGLTLGATTAGIQLKTAGNTAFAEVLTSNPNLRLVKASTAATGTHVPSTSTLTPTTFIINRTGLALADLTNTYYIGGGTADFPTTFTTIADGYWVADAATVWDKGYAPGPTDNVVIKHQIATANSDQAVGGSLTINSGGYLQLRDNGGAYPLALTGAITNNGTIELRDDFVVLTTTSNVTNGGTISINNPNGTFTIGGTLINNATRTITNNGSLTVASTFTNNGTYNNNNGTATFTNSLTEPTATGITNGAGASFIVNAGTVNLGISDNTVNNRTFANTGASSTLSVTGGTLNVYGNISNSATAFFNQSGGNINIDGNAGGNATNSVASGTPILSFLQASTRITLTGGTLTIVDPHTATTNSNGYALYYSNGTSSSVATSVNHTTRFGNGTSTDAGGHTNGFYLNTFVGSAIIGFGGITVNGPTGTNRNVTSFYSLYAKGDVIVNNGGLFTISTLNVGRNLLVNAGGILTNDSTLTTLVLNADSTTSPSNLAQTITNLGALQNLATSSTANLTSFTVNNTNATGVTLSSPISVSGTLTMTSGIINTTATNILRLGTATAAGTLSATPSATNMIVGPFARTFAASRTASGSYGAGTLFPVGRAGVAYPMNIDPTTAATGAVIFSGESFNTNSGTFSSPITAISSRRYEALPITGSANLTNVFVRLSDATVGGITTTSKILQSATAGGAYSSILPSTTAVANTRVTTASEILVANFTGYFTYGSVTACLAPANQATAFVLDSKTTSTVNASFTAATGSPAATGYLVVRYATGATPTDPVDFTNYTAGGSLGAGTIVSSAAASTFTASSLATNTAYDFYVYSYNNSASCSGPVYLTSAPLTQTVTTCAAATAAPTALTLSASTGTTASVSWTASATPSVNYIIDVATNSGFTTFVSGFNGFNVGTGTTASITGLTASNTYYVRVRADVSGCTSANTSTLTITTPCNSIAIPTTLESFATLTLPTCWTTSLISGSQNWAPDNLNDGVPSGHNDANFMGKDYTASDALVVYPPIDMTTSPSGGTLDVWIYRNTANKANDRIRFYANTVANLTGASQLLEIFPLTTVAPTVASVGWYNYTVDIPGSFNTSQALFIIAQGTTDGSLASYGIGFDDIKVDAQPSCKVPTAITTGTLTATTADISWTAPTTPTTGGYDYYVSTTNTTPVGSPVGTVNVPSGTSATISTGLSANTTYYYWVRTHCSVSDQSPWSAVNSFTTPCNDVTTFPWTEDFETTSSTVGCFKIINGNNDASYFWQLATGSARSGTRSAAMYTDGALTNNDYYITPRLAFNSTAKEMTFWVSARSSFEPDEVSVRVSTTDNQLASFTAVAMVSTPVNSTTYTKYTVDLSAYVNQNIYVAFVRDATPANGWYLYLDDVTVQNLVNCKAPTALNTTNIGTTTVTLNWTAPVTSTPVSYEYEVRTSGNAGSGSTGLAKSGSVNAPALLANVTGLDPATTYNYYVRSNCGAEVSAWADVISVFTTACNPFTAYPFTENFDGVTTPNLPTCWASNDVNGDGDKWSTGTQAPLSGTKSAQLYTDGNGGANNDYLISPQFTLNGGQRLKYSIRAYSATEPNDYRLMLSTTGTAPANFSTVLVPLTTVSSTTYTQITVDLSAYTGNVYLAWHVPSGGLDGWYLLVDDVIVENIPPTIATLNPTAVCSGSSATSFTNDGTTLTITGTNINNATSVKFTTATGTVDGTIQSNTATQLVAVIPTGAVTGPVSIYTPNGNVTSPGNLTINSNPTVSNLVVSTALGASPNPACMKTAGELLANGNIPAYIDLDPIEAGGTWSITSGASNVSVDGNGKVTGLQAGSAVIRYTRTVNGCSNYKEVTVNFYTPVEISSFTAQQTTVPYNSLFPLTTGVANFSVNATGSGLTYQWWANDGLDDYKLGDGTNGTVTSVVNEVYAGYNAATLNITNIDGGNAGFEYYCVVSGSAPCTTKTTAPNSTLIVATTGIATDPIPVTLCPNVTLNSTKFKVVKSGSDTLITYNWEYRISVTGPWTPVPNGFLSGTAGISASNELTDEVTLSGITPANSGYQFRAKVVGPNNTATSNFATLTVNTPVSGVSITSAPVNATNCYSGGATTFTVAATTGTVTGIQWEYSTTGLAGSWGPVANATPLGATYTGATGTSLQVTTTGATPATGTYYYRAVLTGVSQCATTASSAVQLFINNPTTTSPVAQTVLGGGSVQFSVTATAASPTFAWEYSTTGTGSWTAVADETPATVTYTVGGASPTSTLTAQTALTTLAGTANYYRAVVTSNGCSVNSNAAQLTINNYCMSGLTSGTNTTRGITRVVLSNVNEVTSVDSGVTTIAPSYFTLYENVGPLNIAQGQNGSAAITLGAGNTYSAVWIDFNKDGSFDASENVGFATTTTGANGTRTFNFTIPLTAQLGITRIRIRGGNNGTAYAAADACTSYASGETEDYLLNISAVQPPTITSLGATEGCVGNNITINGTNLLGATASGVTIGGTPVTAIVSNTSTQIVATIGSGTTGTVMVTAAGGTTSTGPNFIVYPLPNAVSVTGGGVVCTPTALIEASIVGGGNIYFQGTTSNGTSTITPSTAEIVSASGTYYFRAVAGTGCWGPQGSVTVNLTTAPVAPTTTNYNVCLNGSIPSGQGLITTAVGAGVLTGSQTINFNVTAQPVESNSSSTTNIVASATMTALPAGAVITGATITYNGITPQGGSYQSDVYLGLSGALVNTAASGTGALGSTALLTPFNYTRTATSGVTGTVTGGTVNLTYWDSVNDVTGGADAIFALGNVATVVVNYSLPNPNAIEWYTALTGGLLVGTGTPFDPIGKPNGLANTATAGTYTYYAQINNGCSSTRTAADLVVGATLTASATSSVLTPVCGGTSVTLTAGSTGGGGTKTYSWKVGATEVSTAASFSVTPATTTTYNLTVTDGCLNTAPASVTVTVNPAPTTVVVSTAGAYCTSTTLTAANGGSGTIYFQGTTSNGTLTDTPSSSQLITTSGTYYFRAQSAAGCWGTQGSAVVTIDTAPATVTVTPATICQGSSATTMGVSFGTPTTSLGLSFGGNLTSSSPTGFRPSTLTDSSTCGFSTTTTTYEALTFQVTQTGSYTFEMTDNSNYDAIAYITSGAFTPGSCSTGTFVKGDDDSGVAGDEPMMTATLTAGVTYTLYSQLYGSSVTLPQSYAWTVTPPSTSANWYTAASGGTSIGSGLAFNPVGVAGSGLANTSTPGVTTYYVAPTGSPSCRTAVTYTINVKPTVTISGAITPACGVTTANLTSVVTTLNAASVAYYSNAGYSVVVPDPTNVTVAQTYYVRATSTLGCTTDATIILNAFRTIPTAPTGSLAITDSTCASLCTVAPGSIAIGSVTNPNGSGTLEYSTNGGSTWSSTLPAYTASAQTIIASVLSTAGCRSTTTSVGSTVPGTCTTPATPTITADGETTFCAGGSVQLTSSVGSSYLWSNGETTRSITVNTAANYTVQVGNTFGCLSLASAPTTVTVTAQPQWYLDADGDLYYTGAAQASCLSPGTGYTTATLLGGGDCNDSNFDINPGHAEVCYNNVNDNCSTLPGGIAANLSEGCAPVVVNMTPSYDNTILPSFATAIPAVPYTYPGTSNIKYRFSIKNVTTNTTAADIIQSSRYVNIPAALHLYGATYTIKVSAVINDEVVGFFGNTITLTAPAIQLITLAPASCGATLGSLTSILTANPGANATGYTFRIRLNDSNPSPTYGYSSSSSRFVGANTFTGFPLSYGASYKVAVEYTFTDPLTSQPVHSLYGTECIVNTPSIPTTTIASPTCGAQVGSLTTGITAAAAAYATSYQFRIRVTTDNGPTPAYKYTLPNASRFSSMAAIQGITWSYNTNYSVSVRYSVSPTEWSEYGPECILKTPFFPTTQLVTNQCGLATPTSLTQQLNIIPYPGFPNYKVKLEVNTGTEGGGAFEEKVFSYAYFRLNQFALAQPGKSYYVSVAVKQGDTFGDYSYACDIFTPSSKGADLAFKATAYPNPFANNFMIDVRTSNNASVNLKVYDMVGRLIEQRDVRVSDMGTTTIGDRYPSGVYNVVVSQQDSVETLRVVKR